MDVRTQMRRAAEFYGDYEAVVAGDRRLSFGEAWDRGVRLANALIALGIRPGERVGVLEDNSIEAADFYIAGAVANIVRVPLYPRNGREAHEHMLGHTNCRALLVAEQYAAEVAGIADALPDLDHVIIRDGGYENWLASHPAEDPQVPIDPDDIYIIRHTGGTTGKSKGVSYTHRAWLAAGRDWFYLYPPVEPGDSCLHVGPISHGSGYLFLPMWLSGGCNVLEDHFDPTGTLDVMEREGIGYMFMVPTMVNAIAHLPGVAARDWSKLKCLLISAAPISDDTALRAREIFGDVLYQGYGQTEVLPVAMMGPRQWFREGVEGSTPLRSCGMPLPFSQLQIWDEENNPVPVGEAGEIVAKTDGQMTGFWNNPDATAERLVNGWVKTGDIGRLDANGYLYMLDRSDDMIISGGYNIWPMELENVIANHPAVVEVAVFGIPHEKWGETPMAVCVVNDQPVTAEDIIRICAEELGSYKKPGQVELRTEPLPKSPVGKIKRKDLREPFWAGQDRRVAGS
ncbi:MAG TPA: AMP-dependent synthetase [Alphaproteobacteria bacterium]|nr:AMP-dependent synthetase [Alphaproteobacteria bacterium]